MGKPKHTPGPWTLDDFGPNSGNIYRGEIDAKNSRIADLMDCFDNGGMTPEQWVANAHLIAAAPLMYEALSELVNSPNAKQNALWDKARAALTAAGGK
jgi:hypothetical protein